MGGVDPKVRHPAAMDTDRIERMERHAATIRDETAGLLALLGNWDAPLVRAHRRQGRRANWVIGAICLLLPLGLMLVIRVAPHSWNPVLANVVGVFVSFWPLALFLGAAMRAGGSVLDERLRHTAIQLVLTPIPSREIAAAKVLPHLAPFLLGALAALPLYVMAGAAPFLAMGRSMHVSFESCSPLALWPARMASLVYLGDWRTDLTITGHVVGLVMLVNDLFMIWAAAHWGAALMLRRPSLPWFALGLAWRLVLLAVATGVFWLLVWTGMLAFSLPLGFFYALMGNFFTVPAQFAMFTLLIAAWPGRSAVRAALVAFSTFDSLVDEESRPLRHMSMTGWRWWEVNWRR